MRNFNNDSTYVFGKEQKETLTGPSKTIQGEAYTIEEIMEKFTSGLQVNIVKEELDLEIESDFDSIDPEKFASLDPAEQQEILEYNKKLIDETREKLLLLEEKKNQESENNEEDEKKGVQLTGKKTEEKKPVTKETKKDLDSEVSD